MYSRVELNNAEGNVVIFLIEVGDIDDKNYFND